MSNTNHELHVSECDSFYLLSTLTTNNNLYSVLTKTRTSSRHDDSVSLCLISLHTSYL